MEFADEYRGFFRVAQHDVSGQAKNYIAGMLMKAPRKNMERMCGYLPECDYQSQQQFLSDSPWKHRPLLDKLAKDADRLLGGADSVLAIDESGFAKKGKASAGFSRQWNGRLGKTGNCQVGVFAALSDGRGAAPIDCELYLPEKWTKDPERCAKAKIPERNLEIARDCFDRAIANGVRFGWVALDALYDNSPWLLRHIEDSGKLFVGDVRCDQALHTSDPKPYMPRRKSKFGPKFSKLRSRRQSERVDDLFDSLEEGNGAS